MKAVFVDDDKDVLDVYSILFLGTFPMVTFDYIGSFKEAEEYIKETSVAPSFFIVDGRLDDGKTGVDLALLIREKWGYEVFIFLFSGNNIFDENIFPQDKIAIFNGYLCKASKNGSLQETICGWFPELKECSIAMQQ